MGLRQTPSGSLGLCLTHCTLFPDVGKLLSLPQQSLSRTHKSPSMWQPLAGWQMKTPVRAYGRHRRLQHCPQPLQNDPSTDPLQRVDPGAGTPQVPSVAPAAIVQTPPQQSPPCTQASPVWMQ